MKAVILTGFGGVENFRLEEIEIPEIKDREILVRIKASSFNPIDFQMRQGLRERGLIVSPVLGIEFSGIVERIGILTKNFDVGDEVVAISVGKGSNGSYAEYIAISYLELAHKPKNLSFEQAASFPSSTLTAWLCCKRMQSLKESRIFISGASGGVGKFLVLLLKLAGKDHIIATAGNSESVRALEQIGLQSDKVIDYNSLNLRQQLINANDGDLFDYSVDLVGFAMSETCASVLKVNGVYLDVAFLGTAVAREMLFDNGCTIMNIATFTEIVTNSTLTEIVAMLEDRRLSLPEINILGGLNIETVQQAHQLMESNRTFGKKLVMTV